MSNLIVNSKYFRRYLKRIIAEQNLEEPNDYRFIVEDGEIKVGGFRLPVEARGAGEFNICTDSMKRFIKATKHLREQPISIELNSNDSYFTLKCAVL